MLGRESWGANLLVLISAYRSSLVLFPNYYSFEGYGPVEIMFVDQNEILCRFLKLVVIQFVLELTNCADCDLKKA